ncbi:MAG TPA: hypothetical protein VLG50_02925 [Candidatus Saccharimonadales bacterium]|nr:hypothetical protein [Candidatus Saccharimonadales bacterium]
MKNIKNLFFLSMILGTAVLLAPPKSNQSGDDDEQPTQSDQRKVQSCKEDLCKLHRQRDKEEKEGTLDDARLTEYRHRAEKLSNTYGKEVFETADNEVSYELSKKKDIQEARKFFAAHDYALTDKDVQKLETTGSLRKKIDGYLVRFGAHRNAPPAKIDTSSSSEEEIETDLDPAKVQECMQKIEEEDCRFNQARDQLPVQERGNEYLRHLAEISLLRKEYGNKIVDKAIELNQ